MLGFKLEHTDCRQIRMAGGHYSQRMAAAWKRDGYPILDDFVSPNQSATTG